MKAWQLIISFAATGLAGCSNEPREDWYDQSSEQTHRREVIVQDYIDAGLTPGEARTLHDREQWEMNTIEMTKEDVTGVAEGGVGE